VTGAGVNPWEFPLGKIRKKALVKIYNTYLIGNLPPIPPSRTLCGITEGNILIKCCSSSMVKNGENANLRRVSWVQIPDAQKIRGKQFKKPPEKGTGSNSENLRLETSKISD
jgi:hypothetical protein